MKFLFPDKIMIGDTEFNIVYDKKDVGASFSYPFKKKKGQIRFGILELEVSPVRHLNMIIHELKEIIQYEQCTRFTRNDERNSYEFHYTHKEHTDLCSRLAGLLTKFIK